MPTRRQQATTAKGISTNNKRFSDQVQHGEFKIRSRLHMRRAQSNASLRKLAVPIWGKASGHHLANIRLNSSFANLEISVTLRPACGILCEIDPCFDRQCTWKQGNRINREPITQEAPNGLVSYG